MEKSRVEKNTNISKRDIKMTKLSGSQGGDTAAPQRYTRNFTDATSVTVTHNLGFIPKLVCVNHEYDEVFYPKITHSSVNEFSVSWSIALTGAIHY